MLRKIPCVLVARNRFETPWKVILARYISQEPEVSPALGFPPPFEFQEHQVSSALQRQEEHDVTERHDAESLEPLADFAMLGVRRSVRLALHEAFPNIRTPTACQTAFIPAILSRKDVILKDWTGTGK